MGRPRKIKAVEAIEETKYPIVTFGDNQFEIHPIADRDDDYAYEDSARFLTLAVPVGSRVFNELISLGANNQAAIERVTRAQENQEDQASVIIDLVGLLAKGDFGSLLDDVADVMPKLAAIACHYTDPDITELEIKRWTKSPLNKEMWRAVIAQMKCDNVLQQVGSLQGLMSEFGKTA